MALDPGFTLDDVKQYLGYPTGSPSDTSRDFMLQLWLNAAIDAIKSATARNLELAVYRDTLGYRPQHFYLKERPVREILSITYGDSVLTSEIDFDLFKETGRVQFRSGCGWFARYPAGWQFGSPRLVIDYYAGITVLPSIMQMAALVGIQAADSANRQLSMQGMGGGLGVIKQLTVVDVGTVSYATRTTNYTSAALQQAIREHLADYLTAGVSDYQLGAPLLHESEKIADMPGSPYP